jgi:hypothetical protein
MNLQEIDDLTCLFNNMTTEKNTYINYMSLLFDKLLNDIQIIYIYNKEYQNYTKIYIYPTWFKSIDNKYKNKLENALYLKYKTVS